jgi:arginine exporter protein ArgO
MGFSASTRGPVGAENLPDNAYSSGGLAARCEATAGAVSLPPRLFGFSALGYGARLLRPLFARPGTRRVLDAAIAVVVAGLGIGLLTTAL